MKDHPALQAEKVGGWVTKAVAENLAIRTQEYGSRIQILIEKVRRGLFWSAKEGQKTRFSNSGW